VVVVRGGEEARQAPATLHASILLRARQMRLNLQPTVALTLCSSKLAKRAGGFRIIKTGTFTSGASGGTACCQLAGHHQMPLTSNSAAQVSTRLYEGSTPSALRRARTAIMVWPVRRPICASLNPRPFSSDISSAVRWDRFCSRSQHSARHTQHQAAACAVAVGNATKRLRRRGPLASCGTGSARAAGKTCHNARHGAAQQRSS
jgi:hypothetical protein